MMVRLGLLLDLNRPGLSMLDIIRSMIGRGKEGGVVIPTRQRKRGASQVDGAWACAGAVRALCVLAVLAAFVVPFGFAPGALASELSALIGETGQVTGTATDAATQVGIEDLEVCARLRLERFGGHCARTGQNGEYTISEVPAGSYVVEFVVPFRSNLDYASQYYDGKAMQSEAEEVTVTVGETTLGVDAAMRPGGKITGVVTSAVTHNPIAGIKVCAYRPLAVEEQLSRCGESDADGEYTIDPLIGGEYVVVFNAAPNGPLDYAPQYYNDQVVPQQANEVAVTVGETTSGIDAEMQSGGSITGQVTVAATGGPLGGAEVCALSVGELSIGDETPQRCVQTNINGEYMLLQLAAGQDIVEFYDQFGTGYVREYYSGKSSLAEADPLSVAPGMAIMGVDASLHAVGEVTVKPPSPTETTLSTNLASAPPLFARTPVAAIMGSKLVVSRGSAPVRVACSQAACQGSIELVVQVAAKHHLGKAAIAHKEMTLVLATGSFSLARGGSRTVVLHLTPAGKKMLADAGKRHPIAAELILSVKGGKATTRSVLAT